VATRVVNYEPGDPMPQYSDPRADILMFISNRPTVSRAPVVNPTASSMAQVLANGAKMTPIQVVYGHAALASAERDGVNPDGSPKYRYPNLNNRVDIEPRNVSDPLLEMSPLPANRWQLARRAVILDGISIKESMSSKPYTFNRDLDALRLMYCQPDPISGVGVSAENWQGGDVARIHLPTLLEKFTPAGVDTSAVPPALVCPYRDLETNSPTIGMSSWPDSVCETVLRLLYPAGPTGSGSNWRPHHIATILEDVPPELRSNTNLRALPGCVWFQVEFLMGEDPRNSLEYTPPAPNTIPGNPNPSQRGEMMRWVSVEPGQTHLFIQDSDENRDLVAAQAKTFSENDRIWTFARKDQDFDKHTQLTDAVAQRNIRMWPYAIRVTIRAYDSRGRLDRPIVRSLVHRFD